MTAEQAAAIGMRLSDFEQGATEVWECNWEAFIVFEAMGTQWRTSQVGCTGLDYSALESVMSFLEVKDKQETFKSVRYMENYALRIMADERKRRQRK